MKQPIDFLCEELKDIKQEIKEVRSDLTKIKELIAYNKGKISAIAVAMGAFGSLLIAAIKFLMGGK